MTIAGRSTILCTHLAERFCSSRLYKNIANQKRYILKDNVYPHNWAEAPCNRRGATVRAKWWCHGVLQCLFCENTDFTGKIFMFALITDDEDDCLTDNDE